jgi:hypothetical protein
MTESNWSILISRLFLCSKGFKSLKKDTLTPCGQLRIKWHPSWTMSAYPFYYASCHWYHPCSSRPPYSCSYAVVQTRSAWRTWPSWHNRLLESNQYNEMIKLFLILYTMSTRYLSTTCSPKCNERRYKQNNVGMTIKWKWPSSRKGIHSTQGPATTKDPDPKPNRLSESKESTETDSTITVSCCTKTVKSLWMLNLLNVS